MELEDLSLGGVVSTPASWSTGWSCFLSAILVLGVLAFLLIRFALVIGCILISNLTKISAHIAQSHDGISRVVLSVPIRKWESDIVLKIAIPIPSLGIGAIVIRKPVLVDFVINELGSKKNFPPVEKKFVNRAVSVFPRWLVTILNRSPSIRVKEIRLSVRFESPPKISTFADRTGGLGWIASGTIENFIVGVKNDRAMIGIDKLKSECGITEWGRKIDFLEIEKIHASIPLIAGSTIGLIRIQSIYFRLSVEMYYAILPTIAPWIEMPFGIGTNGPQPWGDKKVNLACPFEVEIMEKISFEISTETAGFCRFDIREISASLDEKLNISLRSSGCVANRTSPIYGSGKVISIPAFTMTLEDLKELDFQLPNVIMYMNQDGLVYWVRAMIMCGSKFSFTKRPYRVDIRNKRMKIYYDWALCGIEPADWSAIPVYYSRIVPMRIRLNFATIDIRSERGERLIGEDAFVDCNLPVMEITFNVNNVEAFGVSKKRCALIKKFSGWVPQFSGVRLRDVKTDWMGQPDNDVKVHHVQMDPLGPIPINIRFSDIDVEIADDLVMLIGTQVMGGVISVRRWDQNIGYDFAPMYKAVTVRMSRIRFAPAELYPAVLDVKDWELGVGPTKDCLSFAFLGIKAWVPNTVTVPPIVHVHEPVLVGLRTRRAVPLTQVKVASDYSLQPGGWRDLDLKFPAMHASVAPGLHATTRFIDRMMRTVKESVKPELIVGNAADPTAALAGGPPTGNKGPIKNVSLVSDGIILTVVRQNNFSKKHFWYTEDITESTRSELSQNLGSFSFGKAVVSVFDFNTEMSINLESLNVTVPGIAKIILSEISILSGDGESFSCIISKNSPLEIKITDNAMSMFGAYSAIRECFTKAWLISQPPPKLNSIISHMADVNASVISILRQSSDSSIPGASPGLQRKFSPVTSSMLIEQPSPVMIAQPVATSVYNDRLISANVSMEFPHGISINWSVPNMHAFMEITIPGNKLKVDGIFHGFGIRGDEIFRRLPDLDDQLLIQWLRYPWSVSIPGGGGARVTTSPGMSPPGDSSPKSPSVNRERESWGLHATMTCRIIEYLESASSEGRWEYASSHGPLDTPVYGQLVLTLSDMETRLGGRRICGIDGFEFRSHCHNLPTTGGGSGQTPKLNVSFWTCWIQDPSKGLILDINPDVHLPIFLQLVGSPCDADPTSSVISGLIGDSAAAAAGDLQKNPSSENLLPPMTPISSSTVPPTPSFFSRMRSNNDIKYSSPAPSVTAGVDGGKKLSGLEKFLDQIDLGFRVTLVGVVGRASGFTFASSKISLFKEEEKGRGMILAEIRDLQVAMCNSASIGEAVQPLHSRVCLGIPAWTGIAKNEDLEVFPLIALKQMMLHVGLGTAGGESGNNVFCNIQGGRVWWSPALNRGMRVSLDRTDKTVEMISRWKTRFTNELLARMGKSRRQKKHLESIMNFLDMLIPSNGQIKIILRCADIQASCHNLLNGIDEGGFANGSTTPPPRSPDIPKHFHPFRDSLASLGRPGGSPHGSRPATPTRVTTTTTIDACTCHLHQRGDHVREMELHLRHSPMNVEIPKIASWWTKSAHMKGCALPPIPLSYFFCPPSSRKERAIGAVKYEAWLSDCHNKTAANAAAMVGLGLSTPVSIPLSPVSSAWVSPGGSTGAAPTHTASVRPKPRGCQMLLSSRESIFEVSIMRTKSPSNLRVIFNASFNSIQGSVAPTALRGLVWMGQNGQNILRPVLTIQRVSLIVSSDLFPLKSARMRLLIPRIALSADDDAFHLVTDVFRNCILYRGALIDPNVAPGGGGGSSGLKKGGTSMSMTTPGHKTGGGATISSSSGPSVSHAKREIIIESLLKSLAVADASLPPSTDDLSAEYIVETVSVNLTHRQRCFIQLQISSLVGKHAFSIAHPHRPMVFSVQVGDIYIVSAPPGTASSVFVPSSSTTPGSGGHVVLRSASGPAGGNLITVRGNDRYITLNNREWHVYDTLFLSTSPVVVDVNQELIEELYMFIFPPQNQQESGDASAAPAIMRRLSSTGLNFPQASANSPSGATDRIDSFTLENQQVEVVGNKLLTGRNKQRISSGTTSGLTRQNSPPPPSVISADLPPISPGGPTSLQRGLSPQAEGGQTGGASAPAGSSGSANVSELIFFKFVRFSNIDLIVTFKGKQFSLNNLSLTLKYYLRRRKLATWKEFLDEWGSKVGKQAFGSFVKHGFTRKKGIQDIIVEKLNNLTSSEKEVDKMLFGKYAPKT